jgi:hypothetical protein
LIAANAENGSDFRPVVVKQAKLQHCPSIAVVTLQNLIGPDRKLCILLPARRSRPERCLDILSAAPEIDSAFSRFCGRDEVDGCNTTKPNK